MWYHVFCFESVTFVLRAALVARLVMSSGILLLTSATFIFTGAFVAKLVISFNPSGFCTEISCSYLSSNTRYFVFNLYLLFQSPFVLLSVFLTRPLVLQIFLRVCSFFFPRPCLSESYCVLVTNP